MFRIFPGEFIDVSIPNYMSTTKFFDKITFYVNFIFFNYILNDTSNFLEMLLNFCFFNIRTVMHYKGFY